MGLARLRHRPCGRLSTGQKRRTALARLLAVRRPWWFLDEPLAGLDVDAIALLGELLDEHARGAGAALVTSHQPLPRSIHGLEEMALPRMPGRRRRR
jgi:ABC-type transport system involved in cytochrome c biogenesis, ATPase component